MLVVPSLTLSSHAFEMLTGILEIGNAIVDDIDVSRRGILTRRSILSVFLASD